MSIPGGVREDVAPTTLIAFATLVVLAGGNAPAIRYVSCDSCELDPFWAASTRFLLSSLLFVLLAVGLRLPTPRGRSLRGAALYGILQFGGGFGLIYWGLVRATAGLGQVLIACVPLLTLGLAIVHRQERFMWNRLIGGVISLGGIAVVFSSGLNSGIPTTSMVAILAGSACWAEALVVVKRFPPTHPVVLNALGMGVGGAALLLVSALSRESVMIPTTATTWGAQAYLVLGGSVLVFWLYVFVLRGWTATAASYQLVLIPLVTVPVSAWLQEEPVTPLFLIGSAFVVAGVYIGALRGVELTRRRSDGQGEVLVSSR